MDDKYDFEILVNPPDFSFDNYANVLHDAHQSNKQNGMYFTTADYTGSDIKEHIGEDGDICIIRNGNEICAVGAIRYRKWNKWFCGNKLCADIVLIGVREKYKGFGLSKIIFNTLENIGFKKSAICTMNTAVRNKRMINSRLRDNWKKVDYFSHEGTNFYSVMLAKWNSYSSITKSKCRVMYLYRKTLVRFVRKEDGSYRGLFRLVRKKE